MEYNNDDGDDDDDDDDGENDCQNNDDDNEDEWLQSIPCYLHHMFWPVCTMRFSRIYQKTFV